MHSSIEQLTPALGEAMGGGHYAGRIRIGANVFAVIVAPKAEGEVDEKQWIARSKDVPDALSYCDGLKNTSAMAEAGSKLAQWARGLRIGGHDDWYIPSQDELELCYRALKPTPEKNWCYARSGINVNALTPSEPYTPDSPSQTNLTAFRAGGDEAFEPQYYWSSTRHASLSDCAWLQYFADGSQVSSITYDEFRARAVRRLPI